MTDFLLLQIQSLPRTKDSGLSGKLVIWLTDNAFFPVTLADPSLALLYAENDLSHQIGSAN